MRPVGITHVSCVQERRCRWITPARLGTRHHRGALTECSRRPATSDWWRTAGKGGINWGMKRTGHSRGGDSHRQAPESGLAVNDQAHLSLAAPNREQRLEMEAFRVLAASARRLPRLPSQKRRAERKRPRRSSLPELKPAPSRRPARQPSGRSFAHSCLGVSAQPIPASGIMPEVTQYHLSLIPS